MRTFLIAMVGLGATVFFVSHPGYAEPMFIGLGTPSHYKASSNASGISGDGSIVVGSRFTEYTVEGYRWTSEGGLVPLAVVPGVLWNLRPSDISSDGSTIVGRGHNASWDLEAFRWTREHGAVGLGTLPGGDRWSQATGVSADGSTIVGFGESDLRSRFEAFRWTNEEGMVGLGFLSGSGGHASGSYAYGVSADGATIVGESDTAHFRTEAFRWTRETGMVGLGDLPGGSISSSARAISADGSTIVGSSSSAFGYEAFRWTGGDGMMGLVQRPESFSTDTSVGQSSSPTTPRQDVA